jgi:hypothetical protein
MKIKVLAAAWLLAGWVGSAGAVGNLTDVTVFDRAEGRTLPVYRHQGRYYVVGAPGNEYHVRVRNRTGDDILAVVSVDGVNAVTGETADWNQTGYVLGRHQGYDVRGWRKSQSRVAAFYFTEHRNSYAARTGRPDHVGVIGVAVFRKMAEPPARLERAPRHEPPGPGQSEDSLSSAPAEPASKDDAGGARSAEGASAGRHGSQPSDSRKSYSLGTGHGRNVSSHVTYTDFERATAHPAELIAIHYDTHANLVAMGVIRAPRVAMPSPFPGRFVPDPR